MYTVIIGIEKIQRYIYQRIDDRRVQMQHDSGTLSQIVLASNSVSEDILQKIETKFDIREEDKLVWVSGKVIFRTKLFEEDIRKMLHLLFEEVYIDYGGKPELKYAYHKEYGREMDLIRWANSKLGEAKTKNTIIQAHSSLLFGFQEVSPKHRKDQGNQDKNDGCFAKNMDELISANKRSKGDSTDGKIAVVKADLNNLGSIFSNITDYEEYKGLSALLKSKISRTYLRMLIKKVSCNESEEASSETVSRDGVDKKGTGETSGIMGKILPFYMEGDDIFYAVSIDALLDSINLLSTLIRELNDEICKLNLRGVQEKLGISIGVIFTNNHQPIRYYREKVEDQLAKAKNRMKEEKGSRAILGVSLAGSCFFEYDGMKGTGEEDGFKRFVQEIKELQWLKHKEVFTTTSVYNLMEALENKGGEKGHGKRKTKSSKSQNIKIDENIRLLLYFLMPEFQKTSKSVYDLFFKYYVLSQVVEDSKDGKKERGFDAEKIQKVLIPKLKLILLLTDERFVSIGKTEKSDFRYIVSEKKLDRILSTMFTKPLNYISEQCDCKQKRDSDKCSYREDKKNIEAFFICKTQKTIPEELSSENKRKTINVYKKANFHPSIFFRAKRLIEEGRAELAKTLICKASVIMKENFDDFKPPNPVVDYEEKFTADKFEKEFDKAVDCRNTEWLDNLILFYKYDEQRIKRNEYKDYVKSCLKLCDERREQRDGKNRV